jgi:SAM-dependent methyltransferase
MCTETCMEFGKACISEEDVKGKRVLEVGSYDLNGTLRSIVKQFNPQSYLGVDIKKRAGVDEICDINNLVERYGKESFDLVLTTELMEHVLDWRNAFSNLKNVLRPKGVFILSARSKGFPYHGFPCDFWRFEVDDMKHILSDLSIHILKADPENPGVFVKACKPVMFSENKLRDYELYSMVRRERCLNVNQPSILFFKAKKALRRSISLILPHRIRTGIIRKMDYWASSPRFS